MRCIQRNDPLNDVIFFVVVIVIIIQVLQHIMAQPLYRSYPMRAQMDYAEVRQREGKFDEVTRIAWEDGYRELTTKFGREEFDNPSGRPLRLEFSNDEWARIRPSVGA